MNPCRCLTENTTNPPSAYNYRYKKQLQQLSKWEEKNIVTLWYFKYLNSKYVAPHSHLCTAASAMVAKRASLLNLGEAGLINLLCMLLTV